jgi:hypothetical protein
MIKALMMVIRAAGVLQALISTTYVNSLTPLYLQQHSRTPRAVHSPYRCCLNRLAAQCLLFVLYGPSSVHILLFLSGTT